MDARISSIEEKDYKSQVTEEDKQSPRESLAIQIEELKLTMAAKFETLGVHSKEIQDLQQAQENTKAAGEEW